MRFEFDQAKSRANKIKHGIDFVEAQKMWLGSYTEIKVVKVDNAENRVVLTGMIDGAHWSAVITIRGDAIRIISVRRARNDEKEIYKKHISRGI